ncbi:putative mitogen-activated protein kinase kinase kinase STE-STE11 family [Helianthus annuus]|nr:putative mitogen-activated protein kinase kinase kinase STE-STE11 family [Helianthus annuus]
MNNYTTSCESSWYRLNNIGKGSFGAVSLAVYQSGQTLAVKSVEKKSNEFLRYLESEIRILKSLSSPHIVKYLGDDVTREGLSVYRNLHMEYMPNGTLADVAKQHVISTNDVRDYTWCITSALSYIHARNIVHCDVKGANILLGNTAGTAKLADFGSAIDVRNITCNTRGSPLWMAPEVIRDEYIGPESDVWSLGCTVIEMITGKPAWQDRGVDTLRLIGYSGAVPELKTTTPVPHDLRDFLNKCLKREPSERWSCDQLLQHPFLLSCSPPSSPQITINTCKLSPRCIFDWSDSNSGSGSGSSSSYESTVDTCQFSMNNRCNAKQRIGKLASTSGVMWETEGWEVVRHVTATTTTWEYSDSVDEESVTGSGGVKWEFSESTTSEAWGTMDSVDIYRCCYMYVWLQKMCDIIVVFNLNFIQHIQYTQWLTSTPSVVVHGLLIDTWNIFMNENKVYKIVYDVIWQWHIGICPFETWVRGW